MTGELLPLLAATTLAFSLLAYILLDGTDLGVGIWLGLTRQPADRHRVVLSILPIWDANETWLVLLLGGMLALFPEAYSTFLSTMLVPVVVMLLALVLRGAAIEFRHGARSPGWCDAAVFIGSLLASLFQGILFGCFIQGVPVPPAAPEALLWCTPFTLFCGLVITVLYLVLGAGWLQWRMAGPFSEHFRRMMGWGGVGTLLLFMGLMIWLVHLNEHNRARWQDGALIALFAAVLAMLVALFYLTLARRYALTALMLLLAATGLGFLAIGLTLFPQVLPPQLTLYNSASPPASQGFVLAGFAMVIPFTLFYNTYVFWVFKGKIHRQTVRIKY
ncbi:cytochrome d ubiquinol oxidase subunit II [Nissabacter sp. SGAir0207]|uniref:cytochrome d ubiquinol oxidase subunit II n=1 Tax=Nissabacter sp. SGAir0207 TaxID=2126321 RepID=UPI0010CD1E4A|nr:cytochrome d ubiquinol oxidase subunit II [Nissabacter sp. SGAir0207]QCR38376.1 cytochrome D oxidase subunit II [Nissabacter sp. SGAir0207]